MAKKSKKFDKTKGILVIALGVTVLLTFAGFSAMRLYIDRLQAEMDLEESGSSAGVHVSLGGMGYSYDDSGEVLKATKRTEENIKKLEDFLVKTGERDIELGCTEVYHNVVLSNADETQVLLNYGCDYPHAHMFAVLESDKWRMISPTDKFDLLGIPVCSHVDENDIDASIAPVCIEEFPLQDAGQSPEYRLRT